MRLRLRPLGAFLLLLALLAACSGEARQQGVVERVYDGDTLRVAGVGKVRMIGVDTPERKNSKRDDYYLRQGISRDRLRGVARAALEFNIAHVQGKTVTLTFDHEQRDRYGRLLAYVTLPDGRLLNRLLVEKGLAAVYRRFDFRLKEDFLQAEWRAQLMRVGLWE